MPLTLEVRDGDYLFHGRTVNITSDKNKLLAPLQKQLHCWGLVLMLQPEDWQAGQINRTNGCARVARNDYLDEREKLYQEEHKILSVSEYKKIRLKALKLEKTYLQEVDKFALEAACENLDDAFKKFYKYVKEHGVQKRKGGGLKGYPHRASRFKPNGNCYTTKYTNGNIILTDSYLQLPYLGKVKYRSLEGTRLTDVYPPGTKITKVTVSREGDVYTASVQMERVIDVIEDIKAIAMDRIYGGDAGIKDFLIYGNGRSVEKVPNPRHLEIHSRRLRRLQRSLSRKQYDQKTHRGSNNWKKAKAKVAKEMRSIANMRHDFLHKLSRTIADRCDVFIREDLNIKGMMKNHHLARAISSVGWGTFFTYLQYKLKRKGGHVVKIDRFFPSSKLCNRCGYKNVDLKLKDRVWTCPECGVRLDRDINAKDNILEEGIRLLLEEGFQVTDKEDSPVKMRPRFAD